MNRNVIPDNSIFQSEKVIVTFRNADKVRQADIKEPFSQAGDTRVSARSVKGPLDSSDVENQDHNVERITHKEVR